VGVAVGVALGVSLGSALALPDGEQPGLSDTPVGCA
jgi:hypothetical protein